MRWLMWFAVGVGAGCAAGAYLFRGMGLLILAAVCLLGLIPVVLLRKKWKRYAVAVMVLLGIAFGCGLFFGYDALYVSHARELDGVVMEVHFRATDYNWKTEYGAAADGTVELGGKSCKMRLYLDEYFPITPGDELILPVRFRLTDEGGVCEPTFHRTNGILLLGYQQEGPRLLHGEPGWREFPGILRQKLKERIDAVFPEDTRGFVRALLLGDKTKLSYGTSLAFRISGVSHIVAVSGLHVSLLFALVYLATGKRRFLMGIAGIPLVLLFAAVAGFTPSVTRAAVMQIIMMLSLMVRREYDPPTALAAAVLVILGAKPLTITSVGFQLSVGSVTGIYLFYGKIRKYFTSRLGSQAKGKTLRAKLLRGMATSVAVSLSATVLTTPLVAYYYGLVSLVSLAANLLVVPVISFVFYGIMLACAVGSFGAWVGAAVSLLIRFVFGVTGVLAELPLAAVYTESVYILFWLVLVYVLIVGLALCKPGSVWPGICVGALGLCLALVLSWAEPRMDDYRVTVLDVGQGQSVILQSQGSTFLVDCGGDYDQDAGEKGAEHLLSMGIDHIDGLILSHYDRDHVGGVPYLAERIAIDRIYLPRTVDEEQILPVLLDTTADSEQIWLDSDLEIPLERGSIRIFAPDGTKSGNESCASVLFHSEKYDTLIINDMNAAAERNLLDTRELPDLELLIVGHHGSDTSTSAELVYRTAPDHAFISVGADNSYGHPAPEVLNRLRLYGCAIYRTDLQGDLVFRG